MCHEYVLAYDDYRNQWSAFQYRWTAPPVSLSRLVCVSHKLATLEAFEYEAICHSALT